MWALVESNKVSKVFTRPKSIKIGDIQYPQNIFNLWSADDLKAIGIYGVVIDNTNYKNPEYYINTNQSFAFADDTVTASYGTATARPLDDSTSTDDDNVTHNHKGLKTLHKEVIDRQAYALLQPNDWMVVKAQETGGSVASNWTTYRAAVRTTANDMKTKIDAVSDVDALAALYVYNEETPRTRPLGEWPTQPS
jgi:hypothetical protein